MKKKLLLIAVTAIVCSCSTNEINDINSSIENTMIGFRTLRDKAITRYANDNNDTYMVYANISGQSAWYFNTTVTPTTSTTTGAIDTTAAVYYWPGVQDVYFYAYAPSEESDDTGITSVTDTDLDLTIAYTVNSDANMDFTIAAPVEQNASTSKTVALTFSHMLSKITVVANLSDELTTAGYTLETGYTSTFIVPYNSGTISAKSNTSSWRLNAVNSTTYTDNLSYIIIPQTYTATDSCAIQLNNVVIKRSDASFFSGNLLTYKLTTTDIDNATFEAGKQYNFIITITDEADDSGDIPIFNGEIQFTSSMANWTSETISLDQP